MKHTRYTTFTNTLRSFMLEPMPTLRQATIQDIMTIHELAKQVFPPTYRDMIPAEQMVFMMDWMYSPASLLRQFEEGHEYFIASHKGRDCGYLSIQPEGGDVFHLQKIYVLPDFQGLHIGSFLFREAVRHIKARHPAPCRMRLNVNRNNAKALQFYQHQGMKPIASGDFDIGHGYYMNDYIMELHLG